MLPFLMPLISLVAKPVMGWFTHKAEMQKAKQAAEIRWAAEMATASGKSWKDEYLTIVWTLPIVLGMFGWTAPLERLLAILQQIPEWYTYLLLVITLASFGLSATGRWKELRSRQRLAGSKIANPPRKPHVSGTWPWNQFREGSTE